MKNNLSFIYDTKESSENNNNKKRDPKHMLIIGAGIVLVLLVFVVIGKSSSIKGFELNQKNKIQQEHQTKTSGKQIEKSETKEEVKNEKSEKIGKQLETSNDQYVLAEERIPIKNLSKWERKSYKLLTETEFDTISKKAKKSFVGNNGVALPSKKEGFTSDPQKKVDKDGIPNMYHVPITMEEFNSQLSIIINRIVNPVFGEWVEFQSPTYKKYTSEDVLKRLYDGIATPDFIKTVNKDNSLYLIDYNKDNFGGKLPQKNEGLSTDPIFMGVIRSGDVKYHADNTFTVIMVVDYKTNEKEVFKTKKYTLDLIVVNGKLLINRGKISDVTN